MYPVLLPLYGTLAIHSYGVAIACGLALTVFLAERRLKTEHNMPTTVFHNLVFSSIIVGIVGGRLLHYLTEPQIYPSIAAVLAFWRGGFSILGTVISLTMYIPLFLWVYGYQLLPTLDALGLYAPLAHAFGRIGCFLAGCCYGCPTTVAWGVTYTNFACAAPLYTALHPTQLYSAGTFFIIFVLLSILAQQRYHPGVIFCGYLASVSLERFFMDFFRGDTAMQTIGALSLSTNQLLSLTLLCVAVTGLVLCNYTHRRAR